MSDQLGLETLAALRQRSINDIQKYLDDNPDMPKVIQEILKSALSNREDDLCRMNMQIKRNAS